ncbi:MAG: hypothetical protein CME90_08065 [Hoeflea sp.]|nr:hypothetical protein [Hoeflea sp.]|tara:strand:- start:932 stop:1534 length:603 start_codon:yes stop_codon:yes gene_type:complete
MGAIGFPSRQEVGRSLGGLFTTLEGDKRGLEQLDSSLEGTLRSFFAYVWCWPAQTFLWAGIWQNIPDQQPDTLWGTASFILTGSIFDFLAWVLPALLLYPVSQPFGFRKQYLPLIAATNWFGLIATYLAFLPATVSYFAPVPQGVDALLSLAVYGVTIWFYFRLVRAVLNDEAILAALVTLVTLVSSLIVSSLAFGALGI